MMRDVNRSQMEEILLKTLKYLTEIQVKYSSISTAYHRAL